MIYVNNFTLHVGPLTESFYWILSPRTALKRTENSRLHVVAKVPHVACVLALFCCPVALIVVFIYRLSSRQSLFVFLCRTLSHTGRSALPLFRHDCHDLHPHLWAFSVLNVQTLAISYCISSMQASWLLLMLYCWSHAREVEGIPPFPTVALQAIPLDGITQHSCSFLFRLSLRYFVCAHTMQMGIL